MENPQDSHTESFVLLEQKKDEQYVAAGKCRDHDGKHVNDYRLDAAAAQTLREQLQSSIRLMESHGTSRVSHKCNLY